MSNQFCIIVHQLRLVVLLSYIAIGGSILMLLAGTPTCYADTNQKPASQDAEQAIEVILQRNLRAGKLFRQPTYSGVFYLPPQGNQSWLRAKDGSGSVKGLNLAIEEDSGCGCCFNWVKTDVSDDDMALVAQLDSLEHLCLQGTQVTSVGLKHLAVLDNLRWLDVSHTSLTDDDAEAIAQLRSLEHLDLSSTRITDVGLRRLASLKQLRTINFESTLATGEGLDALQNLPKLSIARGGPKNLRALQAYLKLTRLEEMRVDIDASKVKADHEQDTPYPVHIVGLPRLKLLSFNASDVIPSISVTGLSSLKTLNISDAKALEIADLPLLHHLTLSGAVSRSLLEQASNAKELRSLSLHLQAGSDIESLELISQIKTLESLNVKGDDLSSDALAHLMLPDTLKTLILSNYKHNSGDYSQGMELSSKELLRLLADAPRLEKLELDGVRVMPGSELVISQHHRLQTIRISNSNVASISISHLRQLERLYFYNLSVSTIRLADGLNSLRLGDLVNLVHMSRREGSGIEEVLFEGNLSGVFEIVK